jgi:hypothetical protein
VEFNEKQRGVIRGVIPAALLSVVSICVVSPLLPVSVLPPDEAAARLAWALPWTLSPLLMLMISIMRVANHRFASPEDIDGSGLTVGSARVTVLRAILQNTLEQAVLAVAAYLIWAVIMPLKWLRVIPATALLFVAGRILFMSGYERGAAGRATGFGLTAYPTFGMLVTLAVTLSLRLIGWTIGP